MDPTLANLISIGLGALVTLLGVFLSNWLLARKEQEQWLRERKAEQEKWFRDKLQEIYSQCLYYYSHSNLTAHVPSHLEDKTDTEYTKLKLEMLKVDDDINRERHKWFNLLLLYHPARGAPAYQDLLTKHREGKITYDDIIEVAMMDPRLQSDLGVQ